MKANKALVDACNRYLDELEAKGLLEFTRLVEEGIRKGNQGGCNRCHPDTCIECPLDETCPLSLSDLGIVV